jgi:hypothetical protein
LLPSHGHPNLDRSREIVVSNKDSWQWHIPVIEEEDCGGAGWSLSNNRAVVVVVVDILLLMLPKMVG